MLSWSNYKKEDKKCSYFRELLCYFDCTAEFYTLFSFISVIKKNDFTRFSFLIKGVFSL